jgi:hypothetical protein
MERELLSIVETLKEFRNILLGQRLRIYTDHKNLTYHNFDTERVLRWRLILEEYGPELIYIKGDHNIVADALSRLDIDTPHVDPTNLHAMHYLAEHFGLDNDDLPKDAFPLTYKHIALHQRNDKDLMRKLLHRTEFRIKSFHGGGKKRDLICRNDKIVIPTMLKR